MLEKTERKKLLNGRDMPEGEREKRIHLTNRHQLTLTSDENVNKRTDSWRFGVKLLKTDGEALAKMRQFSYCLAVSWIVHGLVRGTVVGTEIPFSSHCEAGGNGC